MSLARYVLRCVAVLGPLVVLAWDVVDLPAPRPRQDGGLVVLVVAGFVACIFLAVVTQRALGTLTRHADLLVPLGCTVTLNAAVGALGFLPGMAPLWEGNVLGVAVALSLSLLLYILIAVLHAGWTTTLILQAVERDRVDLLAPLMHPGRWLPRTLVVLTIGVGGSFVIAAVGLAVFAVARPPGAVLIGAGSLAWNLFTAALLPGALRSRASLVAALGEGFGASLRGVGRWWIVVLLQMVLLGWFTFLSISYTTTTPGGYTSQTRTNWSVNAFWTGGYEDNCRWYGQVMQVADSQTLPPVVMLLEMLFGLVAVTVKVTVVRRMERPPVEALEDVADWPPVSRRGWVLPTIAGAVALGVLLACGALIYREPLGDALFAREFRQAVARGEDPAALYARLDSVDGMRRAGQLSRDPDPQVRRAVIPYLIGDATPTPPAQPNVNGVVVDSYSGFNTQGIPLLTTLLGDPVAEVRREAIRAVTARRAAGECGPSLRRLLDSGDATDAALVAESLANWDVPTCQEVIADPKRSKELRMAAVRGADRYGWAGRRGEYMEHLLPMHYKMRNEPDAELRHAAIAALRYTDGGPQVWLHILVRASDETDRSVAFRNWVDALVNDTIYAGENYPMLFATENLLFAARTPIDPLGDKLDGGPLALILHVLCTAARDTTAQLDKAQPTNWVEALNQRNRGGGPAAQAFVEELHRLQLVLRVLVAVRDFAADPRAVTTEFTTTMPDEKGAGGPRKLRSFLLNDVKVPLAWCRGHSGAYGSPFLRVNGRFIFADPGPEGTKPRTLGQVLKAVELDTNEALTEYLRKREKD